MEFSEVLRYGKVGLNSLRSSIKFFYSHLSLVLLSLVPSFTRAFQMWNETTPFWSEAIVGLARVLLAIFIVSFASKISIKAMLDKKKWESFITICTQRFNKNWPKGFLAQIIVFIVFLYGLGNLLIIFLSSLIVPTLNLVGVEVQNTSTFYNASVYFLKNISIIPLTIVFVLILCGAKLTKN